MHYGHTNAEQYKWITIKVNQLRVILVNFDILTLESHAKRPCYFSVPTFFIVILSGVRLSSLGTAATIGLLYQPQMIDDGDCGATWWNENWQRKPKYSEKNLPQCHFVHHKFPMT
jgi:hypothetical protein